MHEQSGNEMPVLSEMEQTLLRIADERIKTIETYLELTDMSPSEFLELDSFLEESYTYFLPKLETSNLLDEKSDELYYAINEADMALASGASDFMKSSVNSRRTLTQGQIDGWSYSIEILKKQTIPRLKDEELFDSVKELEGAIMQSEIKIAYDLNENNPNIN